MDMLSALERLAQRDTGGVRLDAERCVHAFDAFATCRACVDECPPGALHLPENGGAIALDPAACTGCGACAHACPVGALVARDETPAVLRCAARVKNQGTIALLCAAHPPIDRGVRAVDGAIVLEGCLAELGPSAYVGLVALGFVQIDVYLDACAGCPLAPTQASIERALEKARRALRPWIDEAQIAAITDGSVASSAPWTVYLAGEPPVPRRRLFHPFATAEIDAALNALSIEAVEQTGPQRIPPERLRLLHALALLPPAGQTLCPAPLAGQVFLRIGADDGCTACGACARACPTGALALEVDDNANTFQLAHLAAICTGCDACLHLCDPDVLYSRGVPFFSALQAPADEPIAAGRFARCARCKARVAEGSLSANGLCEVCAFRRANPFGSYVPERARPLVERQRAPHMPPENPAQ